MKIIWSFKVENSVLWVIMSWDIPNEVNNPCYMKYRSYWYRFAPKNFDSQLMWDLGMQSFIVQVFYIAQHDTHESPTMYPLKFTRLHANFDFEICWKWITSFLLPFKCSHPRASSSLCFLFSEWLCCSLSLLILMVSLLCNVQVKCRVYFTEQIYLR